MKFTEHIDLIDYEGQCLLTVVDAELHDFLDDFFVDRGVEPQVVFPPDAPKRYQLLFAHATPISEVHRLLSQIGTDEIQRIARINSGGPATAPGAA